MKFAILVNEAPFANASAASALAFAEAVIARGHELVRVFFYCDGVANADRLADPLPGQPHLVRGWSELARVQGVDLVVCINAGRKRGLREANLAPGFRISGLGQMIEAAQMADRLVTFGG